VGGDAFTYQATDGTSLSNWATVTVTVTNVNDLPVANADAYEVAAGGTLEVGAPGILENDTDVDGNTVTAVLATNVSGGTLALNADGSFNYIPNAGTASDSFTYFAHDGAANSETAATVTITVNAAPANQPPVANPDVATTKRNTAVVINLTANDTDPDGNLDPTSVSVGTVSAKGGTIVNLNNGSVRFTPRSNFRGTDTFTYTVSDSGTPPLTSNSATVTVNVVK
jgi:VCBS repeat-containing protein